MENNFAFIDSQNLNKGISEDILGKNGKVIFKGWQLDFAKLRVYLKDKYSVEKAFLFIGYIPSNQSLYTILQNAGYLLVFKPTINYANNKSKGNVDAELVMHTILEMPNYDKAVIISGDGDFHCLVEHLNKVNKLKRLFIPNHNKYSSLLRRFSPVISYIDLLRNKLERKS